MSLKTVTTLKCHHAVVQQFQKALCHVEYIACLTRLAQCNKHEVTVVIACGPFGLDSLECLEERTARLRRGGTFKDEAEAIGIANGTMYALTGGLYSRSPANIERVRRPAEISS